MLALVLALDPTVSASAGIDAETAADTQDFFQNWLPAKLASQPSLASDIHAVYVFDMGDSGSWTVDLTVPGGQVRAGGHPNPGCTVTVSKDDFDQLLTRQSSAAMMLMSGKLKVSNMVLGISLRKLLT